MSSQGFTVAALSYLVVSLGWLTPAPAAGTDYPAVEAIFQARCVMCHSGANPPLDLQLDSLDGLLKGSRNGPVVVSGNPDSSELILRIKGLRQPRMPLTGPPFLDASEIALLEQWVTAGMPEGEAFAAESAESTSAQLETAGRFDFSAVEPILDSACRKCHAPTGIMGPAPEGYLLTSYAAAVASSERVRVVPGHPEASELLRRVKGQSLPRMPFDGPPYLTEDEVHRLTLWVDRGAMDTDRTPAAYPLGARIRLQGHLQGGWQLEDGLRLKLDAATRIDKSPGIGDLVEVRGRLASDGEILVERLRRK